MKCKCGCGREAKLGNKFNMQRVIDFLKNDIILTIKNGE